MAILNVEKVIGSLPATLVANTLYLVRTGAGFDFYTTDSTGAIAYSANSVPPPSFQDSRWVFNDFHGSVTASHSPFTTSALSGGTFTTAPAVADANYTGVLLIRSSNTSNSGVRSATTQPLISATGLTFRSIIQFNLSLAARTTRIGFMDTITSADAVDGVYFEVTNLTAVAKSSSNSTRTTAGSTFVLVVGRFYVFDIIYTSDTAARFVIVDVTTGTVVYDVTVSTNVPSGIARAFFAQVISTHGASSVNDLMLLDYIGFGPSKPSFIKIPYVPGG